MASNFIYNPNEPEALYARFVADVGAIHLATFEHDMNAWALFGEDRELIEFYLTDVDSKWVDVFGYGDPFPRGESGWNAVRDRIAKTGATDVIFIHVHHQSVPHGPCPMLPTMAAAAILELKPTKMRLTLIGWGSELDGIMQAREVEIGETLPGVDTSGDFPKPSALLMDKIRLAAEDGDPIAATLLPKLEAWYAGQVPNTEDIVEMLRLITRQSLQPPKPSANDRLGSLLNLPPFIPPDNGRAN